MCRAGRVTHPLIADLKKNQEAPTNCETVATTRSEIAETQNLSVRLSRIRL
jgi:hypothetical protein